MMQPVVNGSVNLLQGDGALTEDSAPAYVRRVVAHALGHAMTADMTTMDALAIWEQIGYDPGLWYEKYRAIAWAVNNRKR